MNMNDDINMFFKTKRDQYTVEIRKQKNELVLQEKRRKLTEGSSGKTDVLTHSSLSRSQQFVELTNNFYEAFKAMNYEKLAESAELIRRAVSNDEAPPLSDLLATGVVPHILKLLEFEYFEHEQMVLECSWIIANLASGTRAHVHYLVSHGAIKKALDLIRHPQESVKDNAIWILANIAGDSFENRDLLIENEIVPVLTGLLEDSTFSIAFVCHVSWLISNLCRGKPYAPYADVEPLLKIVQFFIFSIDHAEVLTNCMWTLSYLSDGDDAMIKAVLDLNVTDTILEMAMSDNDSLVAPALRTAGNLLTGRDDLTERMIEKEVLKIFSHLLGSSRKVFRKEACWGISNITAGASHQIEEVFAYNQGEIVKKLIYMVYNDELDIARECMFCLTNACSEGSAQHIQILVDYEIIDLLVKTLEKSHEPTLLKVSLEALENILERGKEVYSKELDRNPYIIKLAQSDGHGVIEALQSHPDNDVYKVVARIIENHLDYVLD